VALELIEQSATDPKSACRFCDPHSLELGRLIAVELDGAAADRIAAQSGGEEQAGRRPELVELDGCARCGIEPHVETPAELGEVLAYAQLGIAVGRVDDVDLDQSGGQQSLDLGHRGDEALAARLAQRLEKRAGELVAATLEQIAFGTSGRREACRADALVVLARFDPDELGGLEGAEKAAEIARVEVEPSADDKRVRTARLTPISQSSRASPSGLSRARYRSFSAPTRCVINRLKLRTWLTAASTIL